MSRGQALTDLFYRFEYLPLGKQLLVYLIVPLCLVLFVWLFNLGCSWAGVVPTYSMRDPNYRPPRVRAYRDVFGFLCVLMIALTVYSHFSR
jgi:hypothetical protein